MIKRFIKYQRHCTKLERALDAIGRINLKIEELSNCDQWSSKCELEYQLEKKKRLQDHYWELRKEKI